MARKRLPPSVVEDIIRHREDLGWSAERIARKFKVSRGCVDWHCLKGDIDRKELAPPSLPAGFVVQRAGRVVRGFSGDEDAKILALRMQGLGCSAIACTLDPPRLPNSVLCRLYTLARREKEA